MTITDLDAKYALRLGKLQEETGLNPRTVQSFLKGESCNIRTAAKIVNALPITPKERRDLINSYFEPKE